jgi:hypothetical protein
MLLLAFEANENRCPRAGQEVADQNTWLTEARRILGRGPLNDVQARDDVILTWNRKNGANRERKSAGSKNSQTESASVCYVVRILVSQDSVSGARGQVSSARCIAGNGQNWRLNGCMGGLNSLRSEQPSLLNRKATLSSNHPVIWLHRARFGVAYGP